MPGNLGIGDVAGIAVGHDLVYLPEFRRSLQPRFIDRAFTAQEVAGAAQAFDAGAYFGARWAAKEAAYKALCDLSAAHGLPLDGLACFRDYEVARRPKSPVPALVLHGQPRRRMEVLAVDPIGGVSLSLTGEHEYVAAFVALFSWPVASGATSIKIAEMAELGQTVAHS